MINILERGGIATATAAAAAAAAAEEEEEEEEEGESLELPRALIWGRTDQ